MSAPIKEFWWKIVEAVSTVAGLIVLALSHWALEFILGVVLKGSWVKYHHWTETATFAVFGAVYVFLLIEILELFWPEWLKWRPATSEGNV